MFAVRPAAVGPLVPCGFDALRNDIKERRKEGKGRKGGREEGRRPPWSLEQMKQTKIITNILLEHPSSCCVEPISVATAVPDCANV